jgi:hypothetical protein
MPPDPARMGLLNPRQARIQTEASGTIEQTEASGTIERQLFCPVDDSYSVRLITRCDTAHWTFFLGRFDGRHETTGRGTYVV